MNNYTSHYSVLLPECIEAMKLGATQGNSEDLKFGDMTFGGGGHTFAMAQTFPMAQIYSVDQDPDALENGYKNIKSQDLDDIVFLNEMNFEQFPDWCLNQGDDFKLNGIIMDLGVSSHHFDQFDRGFSFREDAPLDMRMSYQNDNIETAADVLNNYSEEEIADIIFKYGEERLSRRIAKQIVEHRAIKPIETTKELENIVFHSYPSNQRHKKTHPATRTFQALRIHVNRELDVLENTIEKLFGTLAAGGTLAIISFHSLEDRIVKHKFKDIFQTNKNIAKILTKKPIYPSEEEVGENPRSRSAKLRVLQKIG